LNGATTAQLAANQTVGAIVVQNTGATTIDSTTATTESLTIGGNVTMNSGAGAFTLGNATNGLEAVLSASETWTNSSTSTLTLVNGLTTTGADILTLTGPGTIALNGALTNGSASHTLALTVVTGNAILGGSNSFTGGATVTSGTLTLTNANALAGSPVTLTDSTGTSTLNLRADTSTTFSSGTISMGNGTGAAFININADEADSGGTAGATMSIGTLSFSAGTAPSTGSFTNGWVVTNGHNDNLTVSSASLTTNTQSWANNMVGGTLTITSISDSNNNGRNLWLYGNNASALTSIGSYTMTLGASTGTYRTFQIDTLGTVIMTGADSNYGSILLDAGTYEAGQETSLFNDNATYWVNSTTAYGTTADNGIHVYAGATLALEVGGAANSIGDFTNTDIAVLAPIAGNTAGGILGLDTTPGNFTLTDTLTTSGLALTKLGTNTLTLSGPNTFTGTVTVANGALSVSNVAAAGNLGSGTSAIVLGGVQAGTGSLTTGDLVYTGAAASFTRGFTIFNGGGGGEVDNTGSGLLTIATGNVTGTGNFTTGGNNNITVTSNISNTGAFTDNNTDTVTLSGTGNSYTGATTVNAGSLIIGSGSSLGSTTAALAVNNTNTGAGTAVSLTLGNSALTTGPLSGTIATPSSGTNSATIYNNGQLLTVNQTSNGTYAGAISGSGGFTVGSSSTATLNLTGASSYTGATTVNAGTLQISGAGSLAGTAVTLASGGTLMIGANGSSATTTIGTSGAGSLSINGGGTLSFYNGVAGSTDTAIKDLDLNSGTNGATALTLGGGTGNAVLNFGVGSSSDEILLGGTGTGLVTSLSGTITINLNVVTALNGHQQELIAWDGTPTGSGAFTLGTINGLGAGVYSLSLSETAAGLFLNESATSTAYWKGGSNTSWSTLANFTTDAGGTTARTAALDNQTSVTFIATGGANYGSTTLGANTTINNLTFNTGGVGIGSGAGSNTLTIYGSGNVVTVNTGLGAINDTISAAVAMGGSQTWTVGDATSTLTVSGNVSGSGDSLIKAGNGTLILSGVNSYNGSTTVQAGYLNASGLDALDGTSGVVVNNGASLQVSNQNGNAPTYAPNLTISGTGTGGKGALESIDATGNSYNGNITLGLASSIGSDTGTFTLGVAGGTTTLNNAGFALTLVGAGSGVLNDIIGGSGGLTMSSTGLWQLGSTNTYTGTTTVNSGTLQIGNNFQAGTLGNGNNTLAMNGGTVDLNGWALGVGNLTGSSGTITNSYTNEIALTLTTTGTASYAGSINNGSGIVDFYKQGSGTQTLTGSNSYSGPTTVAAGALNIAGSNALSSSTSVTVQSGAALQLSGGVSPAAVPLNLSGTGITGGALENVTGTNTYSGAITLSTNSSLGSDAGLLTVSGGVTGSGLNLALVGAGNGLVNSVIGTGGGSLTMSGTGTWTLSANNTYTGTTNVNSGTLIYTAASVMANTAGIKVSSTSTATPTVLDYGGSANATVATPLTFSAGAATNTVTLGNVGTGSITYSATPSFGTGTTTLALGNASDTIGGSIGNLANGAGGVTALVKQGTNNDVWVLTGTNTYTGQTLVSGGVLQASSSSLPTGNIVLQGASSTNFGILQTSSGTLTVNLGTGAGQYQWAGNGGFAAMGGGTLTLNVNSGAALSWNAGGFNNTQIGGNGGAALAFGSNAGSGEVILANNLNLNSNDPFQQNIYVATGTGSGNSVLLSGVISNGPSLQSATGLTKTGGGTLILTNANNNYAGYTAIYGGTIIAEASSTITPTNSTSTSTGVFGSGFGPLQTVQGGTNTVTVSGAAGTGSAVFASIYLGSSQGGSTAGGIINPTLLAGSTVTGGTTTIANPIVVDWNAANTNGGQIYGVGGATDSNNTFSGVITLSNGAATGNSFDITQVATTGSDALNLTGGITTTTNNSGTVTFANVGAVNVSSNGINQAGTGIISVIQSGSGTTTLAATNSYTGATTINAGEIYVTGSTAAGSAVTINTGGALGGLGGTVNGAVTLNSGGSVNLVDGSIGTLHIGSLTTTGGGTFDFEIGGGTTATDLLADAGAFTASGTSTITIANLGGTAQTLASGTYTLISGSTTALNLGNFSLSDGTLDNRSLQLLVVGDNLDLVVASNFSTGTYTLATTTGSGLLHVGASTTATTTLTNSGTGSADALNYSGLGSTAGTGSVTGSTGTGGPVNNGGSTAVVTQTYTATTAGTDTLTPGGSVTGANGTGAAVDTGTTVATVQVYSGTGSWTGTGGTANWGTAESSAPANWTATGGIPGITPGFLTTDSAYFGSSINSNQVVNLNGASPYLNSITFNNAGHSYDIEQGGTGTIHLDSTGTATITDSAGNHTIGAPIELDSAAATSVASSSTLTINGTISQSGTQTLAIGGVGTTALNGANSFSGGTSVAAGATLLVGNSSGSAVGSGPLTLAAGATLRGTGIINASSFAIGGSGSPTSLIVGTGTDTTSQLTLKGSGANTITNTTLSFNLSAATPGQGNELNVGTSAITFSNTTLALNVSGTGIIPAYSSYILVAGTGSNQYSGITAQNEIIDGTTYDVITSGLALTLSPSLANTWYAGHSFLYLNTAGGVDDIDVDVVPEPGTWALMLGGLAALVFWQRRRRQG
jgi:autotransporter-associated beta strand protein